MTGLSIGKYISEVLKKDENFQAAAKGHVYPVCTPGGLEEWPAVTYKRSAVETEGTKDGPGFDRVSVELTAASDVYAEAVAVIEAVRAALEGRQGTEGGVAVGGCTLTDSFENYDMGSGLFIEGITLAFEVYF